MKTHLLSAFCLLFVFAACKQNAVEEKKLSKEDLMKIGVYDRLFKKTDNSFAKESFFDQPINNKLAKQCISRYKSEFGNSKLYTEFVSFGSDSLSKWLSSLDPKKYKEIRMYLGIYTDSIINQYHKDTSLIGRLSIFLWPSTGNPGIGIENLDDDGEEVYNLGDIHPKKQ